MRNILISIAVALLLAAIVYFVFLEPKELDVDPDGANEIHKWVDAVYLINLERRPDRLAQAWANCQKVGLPFQRMQAIDYRNITVPDWIHTKKYERLRLTPGAYALALTTAEIVKDAIQKGHRTILIMEDDVEWHPQAQQLWKQMQHKLPSDWQVLYFSQIHYEGYAHVKPRRMFESKDKPNIIKPKRCFSCAAYMLNASVFEEYLDFCQNPHMPIDNWLFEKYQKRSNQSRTAYGTYPALAWQSAGFSDIEADNGFVERVKRKDGSQ